MDNTHIDIYWFSGTGNTLLAARAMAEEFGSAGRKVTLTRIEDADPASVDVSHALGVACTVACQSTYPPVWQFLRELPNGQGAEAFMVDTVGQSSGGIVGPMRRLLASKGYAPIGAREIIMPSNFFQKDRKIDPARTQQKVEAGLEAARQYARELLAGTAEWRQPHWYESIWDRIGRSQGCWNLVRRMVRLSAEASKCVHCGLCAKLCPVDNITQEDDRRPSFANRCIACMRCFAYCPKEAIVINGKDVYYRNRPVTADDLLGKAAG